MKERYQEIDDKNEDAAGLPWHLKDKARRTSSIASRCRGSTTTAALEGVVYTPQELTAALHPGALAAEASMMPVVLEIRNHKAVCDYIREEASRRQEAGADHAHARSSACTTCSPATRPRRRRRARPPSGARTPRRSWPRSGSGRASARTCRCTAPTSTTSPSRRRSSRALEKLVDYTASAEFREFHPIKQAATVQHLFLQIFPFTEHSGKVGRMCTNLILLRHGYLPARHPLDRSAAYYEAFRGTDAGVPHAADGRHGELARQRPQVFKDLAVPAILARALPSEPARAGPRRAPSAAEGKAVERGERVRAAAFSANDHAIRTAGALGAPFPEAQRAEDPLLESPCRRIEERSDALRPPCPAVPLLGTTRSARHRGSAAARDKLERLLQVARGQQRALDPHPRQPGPGLAWPPRWRWLTCWSGGRACEARVGYGGIIGRAENIAFVKVLQAAGVPRLAAGLRRVRPARRWWTRSRSVGNHSLPPRLPRGRRDRPPPAARREPAVAASRTWAATSAPPPRCWWSTCGRRGWSPRSRWPPRSSTGSRRTPGTWAARRRRRTSTATCGCSRACDKQLLAQIEHPELPARYFQLYHTAIERAKVYGDRDHHRSGRGLLAGHGGRGGRADDVPRGHEVVAGVRHVTAASSTSRCA